MIVGDSNTSCTSCWVRTRSILVLEGMKVDGLYKLGWSRNQTPIISNGRNSVCTAIHIQVKALVQSLVPSTYARLHPHFFMDGDQTHAEKKTQGCRESKRRTSALNSFSCTTETTETSSCLTTGTVSELGKAVLIFRFGI